MRTLPGSFGSRSGEPWSSKIAQANSRTKPSETAAGTYGAVIAPSQEAIRSAIEAQVCPWCGAGPFKMLAGHVSRVHGVGGVELRILAGLPKGASICSSETSLRSRDALLSRDDWKEMRERGLIASGAHSSLPENVRQERADSIGKFHAERMATLNEDRDQEIIALIKSGVPQKDVANQFGLTYASVWRMLKRRGVSIDGRRMRGDRMRGKPFNQH